MLDLPFGLALDVLRGTSGRAPRISVSFRHHFRSSRCLACSSRPAAECFYLFGFFFIQPCKAAFCIDVHTEQFVELCVYGLSVAMLRSLNEQRHEKCRDADCPMPAESVRIEERIGLDRDRADVAPPWSRRCSSRRENKRHGATFRRTRKHLNCEHRW
jgi:hypothetical protein